MSSLLLLFFASLIGSPHCAGMCGGFVTLYGGSQTATRSGHATYNVGRLLTYLTLGISAAGLGGAIDSFGFVVGLQHLSAIIVAGFLVFCGLSGVLGWSLPDRLLGRAQHAMVQFVSRITPKRIATKGGHAQAFLLGLTSTLLPCGWLYSFVALAGASGDPSTGAVMMFVFWLGTLPIMVSIGVLSRLILSRSRILLPRLTSALVLSAGLFCFYEHVGQGTHDHTLHKHEHEHAHHNAG